MIYQTDKEKKDNSRMSFVEILSSKGAMEGVARVKATKT